MILISGARMEGMSLCSLSCPHSEKPNLTNPLTKISLCHGLRPHQISMLDLSFLICTRHWSGEGCSENRTSRDVQHYKYPPRSKCAGTCQMRYGDHSEQHPARMQTAILSTAIIESSEVAVFPSSLHAPLYCMQIFLSTSGFIFCLHLLSWLNTLLTANTIYSYVLSDVGGMLMKSSSREIPHHKCLQMTTHLLFKSLPDI